LTTQSPHSPAHRLAGIRFVILPILALGFVTRLILSASVWTELSSFSALTAAFAVGVLHDLLFGLYASIPVIVYLLLVPQRLFQSRAHQVLTWFFFAFVYWSLLFVAVSEWVFWEEFGVRFNFIAVDYLVYTTEVVDNILESYPVAALVSAIAIAALALAAVVSRTVAYRRWLRSVTPPSSRLIAACALLAVVAVSTALYAQQDMPRFGNRYVQEVAKNGEYSFFAAFRNNELGFRDFYQTADAALTTPRIRALVSEPISTFDGDPIKPYRRFVENPGTEKRPNVIQITVESLSAEYLGIYGNSEGLTPNLDRLAKESLNFTRFMATGTRTVRGMESLTLSVPPTPGRSIVKRPDNDGLFNIGTVFRAKEYKTAFFYGGRGYFDNMNAFFGGNGFEIHDQASADDEDISFTNAWGVSDEDLYGWVLKDADKKAAAGLPFYDFVMTTSNHRPYTYPDQRIDIPSHSGRQGAVKYTDYAIGKFLEEASKRPWFDNTVFVIVADHCAGSAGKTDVPVENYHIPLMIYAPGLIEPGEVDTLSSQIDYAPTLFSLLGWSYDSEFFGKDILAMAPEDGRALLGTYQSLGLMQGSELTVLKPMARAEAWHYDPQSHEQTPVPVSPPAKLDVIAYYQTAADAFDGKDAAELVYQAAASP
jgi:phosphoglycerol transferase MdoB-like AlkP superfamily enzyme